jgi:very-short-patch-repair endonuclease
MTEAEQRLWGALRELKGPNRFRRQHPIGRNIVDFACPPAQLAIEVDGGQHAMMREADSIRSLEITDHGYGVVRFWNGDVMENLEGVLQIISDEMKLVPHGTKSREARKARVDPAERPTSPSPPRMRRVPPSPPWGRRGPIFSIQKSSR